MNESDEQIAYVCMNLRRWGDCELKGCPPGIFGGLNDGSVGFMVVFDDVDDLIAAYPDAEIMKILKVD